MRALRHIIDAALLAVSGIGLVALALVGGLWLGWGIMTVAPWLLPAPWR